MLLYLVFLTLAPCVPYSVLYLGPNMVDFEHLFNVKPATPRLNITKTVTVIKMQFKPLLIELLLNKETRRYDPNDDARVRLLLDNKLTHPHITQICDR